ncbi:MAG: hypothetical protein ACLGHQ_08390 [Acidimicrobiia bacterium]
MQRTRSLVVTIAALGLVASACGSDDADPADTPVVTEDEMSEDAMSEDDMSEEMSEDEMPGEDG